VRDVGVDDASCVRYRMRGAGTHDVRADDALISMPVARQRLTLARPGCREHEARLCRADARTRAADSALLYKFKAGWTESDRRERKGKRQRERYEKREREKRINRWGIMATR